MSIRLSKIVPFFTPVILLNIILSIGSYPDGMNPSLYARIFLGMTAFLVLVHVFILFERNFQRRYRSMVVFSLMVLLISLFSACIYMYWAKKEPAYENSKYSQTILTIGLLFYLLIRMARAMQKLYTRINNPVFIFATSFLLLALSGAGLLLLPEATVHGISFVDAFFTSTSAVCVTGLTALDTAKDFTFFGKLIILILIQLGGLGILTITSFFGYFFRGAASFKEGLHVSNFLSSDALNNVLGLAVKVVSFTLIIEGIGALLIYFSIANSKISEIERPLFFSIFHAVSAFCNAGFSTLSEGLYSYMIRFNYFLQIIMAVLLILGGIGFNILFNFYNYIGFKIKRIFYRVFRDEFIPRPSNIIPLNTRIVLITTGILLIIGTVFYYVQEYDNTLAEHSGLGKWSVAFFSSATPRTAGFQIVNMSLLKPATIFFIMFLMWIGASPASTGGGIKTSTFALAIMNVFSLGKGKGQLEIFGKEIPYDSIKRAFAIIMLSLLIIGIGIFTILALDPQVNMLAISFETFSAFSTTGLSVGITPYLSTASKYVLIVLMFVGRIGAFNLLVGLLRRTRAQYHRYPQENILIN